VSAWHKPGNIVSRLSCTDAVYAISGAQFPELLFKLITIQAAVARLVAGDPVAGEMCPFAEGADIFLFFIHNGFQVLIGLISRIFVNKNHSEK
jgi:hypothetical protein